MDLEFVDQSATHIFFQHYEKEEAEIISSYVKKGMRVLDIGANIGYFTLLMAQKVGANGRVYSFEPNPRMVSQLKKNIGLNKDLNDGRIKLQDIALGNSEGESDFYSPVRGAEGVGGLKDTKRAEFGELFRVRVSKLDTWISEEKIEKIDFVKMDVEGGELDILLGAPIMLGKMRPTILFEVVELNTAPYGYSGKDIFEYLRLYSYQIMPLSCGYNFLATPES
jgi:FkbM family methyltransferase